MEWIKSHKSVAALIVLVVIFIAVVSRTLMSSVFAMGMIAVIAAMVVALIKPSAFKKWFKGNSSRGNILKYLGLALVLLLVATVITAPPTDTDRAASSTTSAPAPTPAPAATQPAPQPVPAPAPTPPPAKAKFEAVVGRSSTLDPKTRVVMVTVRNTSTVTGSPSCFVRATSLSGNYKGYDTFSGREVPVLKAIAAGEETTFYARLTITDEGAAYATEATATCS